MPAHPRHVVLSATFLDWKRWRIQYEFVPWLAVVGDNNFAFGFHGFLYLRKFIP